jgi:hypothetical protein
MRVARLINMAGLTVATLLGVVQFVNARTIYVAPGGNDGSTDPTNDQTPLKTISAAAGMAVAGDEIVIRAGVYRETVSFRNSGETGNPITVRPYGDGRVVVSGADTVGGWQRHSGSIYVADLPSNYRSTLHYAEQVFCDGEMMVLARHPNIPVDKGLIHYNGAYIIDEVVGDKQYLTGGTPTPWGPVQKGDAQRFAFRCDDLTQPAGFWEGGIVCAKNHEPNSADWGFYNIGPILSYSTGQVECILYRQPGGWDVNEGEQFCLMGVLGALDAPGEWFHDTTAGRLYVWLPGGGDPSDHRIEVRRRDYAFELSARSHITIRGLHVFSATITTDTLYGDGTGFGAWLTHNRGSVDASAEAQGNAPANHITLDGIRAQYVSHFLGHKGNQDGEWTQSSGIMLVGTGHLLQNSLVAFSAGNAVSLFGRDHVVRNNIFHDINYTGTLTSGIYVAATPENSPQTVKPTDIEIANNTFVAAGWGMVDGKSIHSTSAAAPARIHHNFFDAPGLLTHDVGAFRLVGHRIYTDQGPKPPLVNGTRIDHNFVRGCATLHCNSIYYDFCDGYVTDHNVVWDSYNFVNMNDGGDLLFYNNTGLTEVGGIGGWMPDGDTRAKLKNVIVRNNLLNKGISQTGGHLDPSYTRDHNIYDTDISSYFVDAASGDFRLTSGCAAVDSGIAVAGYTDGARDGDGDGTAQPDVGAFEYGAADWRSQVGADWEYVAHPTSIQGGKGADNRVHLYWNDNANNEEHYYVERGYQLTRYGGWVFEPVAVTGPNQTSCILAIDGADTTHDHIVRYRVRARHSRYSPTLHVNTREVVSVRSHSLLAEQGRQLAFRVSSIAGGKSFRVSFYLANPMPVRLALYDAAGRLVRTIVRSSGNLAQGAHTVMWDGSGRSGGVVASGPLILDFRAGPHQRRSMIVQVR